MTSLAEPNRTPFGRDTYACPELSYRGQKPQPVVTLNTPAAPPVPKETPDE